MNGSGKHTSGSRPAGLLAVSICLNLALAAAAILLLAKPASPTGKPAVPLATTVIRTQLVVAPDATFAVTYITNAFHWRQLESTNCDEYIANLRAVGCPENTVRDILLADLARALDSQRRALDRGRPYWEAGRRRKLADLAEAKQLDALRENQRASIRRLLGIEIQDPELLHAKDLGEQALTRFLLGPMPDETLQRLVDLIEKSERISSEFTRRRGGILTEADEAGLRNQASQYERQLSGLLTATEFDEARARLRALEFFVDHGDWTEAVNLSPAEARQIALALAALADPGDPFDLFRSAGRQPPAERAVHEAQFTNTVAALLGEKRFADFVRAQDRNFMELFTLARDNNLPRESAVKVYDLRQFAADEVQRLRDDAELDDAARRQQFEEMQQALQQSISEVLGAEAYQDYLRRNGAWITNVTKL